jgi:hypothetical protein
MFLLCGPLRISAVSAVRVISPQSALRSAEGRREIFPEEYAHSRKPSRNPSLASHSLAG